MKRVFIILAVSAPAAAQNGVPDGYCFQSGDGGWPPTVTPPREIVFRVDDDLDGQINVRSHGLVSLSDAELRNALDMALQNEVRQSRARIRARVHNSVANCSAFDSNAQSCIDGAFFGESNVCDGNRAAVAHAGCGPEDNATGCVVVFCLGNLTDPCEPAVPPTCTPFFDWAGASEQIFAQVVQHEYGHVFGVGHADQGCATSDGCEGELSCGGISFQRSVSHSHGDSRGWRRATNQNSELYINRKFFSGSMALNSQTVTTDFVDFLAFHAPRISCLGTVPTDICATVRAYRDVSTNYVAVALLKDWTSSGWNDYDPFFEFVGQSQFAPDIVLAPTGTGDIYIATVSQNHNAAFVRHITTLGQGNVATSIGYDAAYPTRIAYNYDLGAPIVIGAEIVDDVPLEDTGAPRWRMDRINWNGTTLSTTKLDFGVLDDLPAEGGNRLIASDFDFDCEQNSNGRCVLVAVLHDVTATNRDVGKVFSRSFTVTSGGTVNIVESDWVITGSDQNAQAIIGVALTTGPKLVVSEGRRSGESSSSNTRIATYDGYDVSDASYETSFVLRGDAESCATPLADGVTMGAATPHGGYSISWCPTCGPGDAGRIESLHFGQGQLQDVCF